MAKSKIQMKEALSQFVDLLVEEEIELLRREMNKFRTEIKNEMTALKNDLDTSLDARRQSNEKDLAKMREAITQIKSSVAEAKVEQTKTADTQMKSLQTMLDTKGSAIETKVESLANQIAESMTEHEEEMKMAMKEFSKRIEHAEKVSSVLNTFANNLSSMATPQAPVEEAHVTKESVKPHTKAKAPAKHVEPVKTQPAAKKSTNIAIETVEDAFIDNKMVQNAEHAQIIPPLPQNVEGHKVNPIKVDELSGQQLYVP